MHILSTALTFAGAGGLGLAAGLVLDYLGLLGGQRRQEPGTAGFGRPGSSGQRAAVVAGQAPAVEEPGGGPHPGLDPRVAPAGEPAAGVSLGAVLAAADAIGEWAPGERAGAWVRFAAVAAVGVIVGGLYGARSSLGEVDPATRRLSASLATSAALIGVVVSGWIGVQARALIMGVLGGFFLSWVLVRAWRSRTSSGSAGLTTGDVDPPTP